MGVVTVRLAGLPEAKPPPAVVTRCFSRIWPRPNFRTGQRRGAEGDGNLSDTSWVEEERPEVAPRKARGPLASTAQDDQLLLEQEILRHHRSHATGTTQLRGHDGQVQ